MAYTPPTRDVLHWVARQLHPQARVIAAAQLHGGITADMDRITIVEPTGRVDLVLRRWRADEAHADALVTREAAALTLIEDLAITAPRLLAADADGMSAGVRCTLTSVVPGQPQLRPDNVRSWLGQLADAQAAVHRVPGALIATWEGLYAERRRPLDWLADPGLREAARTAPTGPLVAQRTVVHGDYQPFNVLWIGDRLSAVVDWPNAAMGNPGHDVGHCRLNLAVLFGPQVAAQYLAAYERAADTQVDRRADLQALLAFTTDWLRFIPLQVAGRTQIDVAGMPDRVATTVRDAVNRME